MAGRTWSDAELDALRRVGDPLADDTITAIFAAHDVDAVRLLLRHLVDNDHPLVVPPDTSLPPGVLAHVEAYFARSDATLPSLDAARIVAGERGASVRRASAGACVRRRRTGSTTSCPTAAFASTCLSRAASST